MNLNKHLEFFNPVSYTKPIHIIGCGAIGSNVAVMLARLGVERLCLWDFDTIESKNITNQAYRHQDIKKLKTIALKEILKEINPSIKITLKNKGYNKEHLTGAVFMLVDDIELRKSFVTHWQSNPFIDYVFDARMRLTDGQCYAAKWTDRKHQEALLNSMQFSKAEAKKATPVSACGTELSVNPTVYMLAASTVSNFINAINGKELGTVILLDAFQHTTNKF